MENYVTKSQQNSKITLALNNMKRIFEFQWRNELSRDLSRNKSGSNKMKTYYLFKTKFEYEQYLNFQGNFHLRRLITKLRISAHSLEIETGRYNSKKNNKIRQKQQLRICKHCELEKIEDEEHVLLFCPKYEENRQIMLSAIKDSFNSFENLRDRDKFIFIMKCFDWEATKTLSNMVTGIKELRGCL